LSLNFYNLDGVIFAELGFNALNMSNLYNKKLHHENISENWLGIIMFERST